MQWVGSVVFFTHLSLSYYLHIFLRKEVLEDTLPLLSVGAMESHTLNLSFLAILSAIVDCPTNSLKSE